MIATMRPHEPPKPPSHHLENSALCLFMSKFGESDLMLVTDNAKLPACDFKKFPNTSDHKSHRRTSLSRWEGSPPMSEKRKESRWLRFNNENPRCAGLTCPDRPVWSDNSPPAPALYRKTASIRPPPMTDRDTVLPPLPKRPGAPAYKKLSIPKPTGRKLLSRKVTV